MASWHPDPVQGHRFFALSEPPPKKEGSYKCEACGAVSAWEGELPDDCLKCGEPSSPTPPSSADHSPTRAEVGSADDDATGDNGDSPSASTRSNNLALRESPGGFVVSPLRGSGLPCLSGDSLSANHSHGPKEVGDGATQQGTAAREVASSRSLPYQPLTSVPRHGVLVLVDGNGNAHWRERACPDCGRTLCSGCEVA